MTERTNINQAGHSASSVEAVEGCVDSRRCFVVAARFLVGPLLVAFVIVLCYSGWSYWRFGSFKDGIEFLSGYRLVAEQSVLDIGKVRVGAETEGNFVLKNLTDKPITIIGAKSDCSCMVISGLPIRVEPRCSTDFAVRYTPLAREGNETVTHRILLYLDIDSPEVVLTLSADILPVDETETVASVKAGETRLR